VLLRFEVENHRSILDPVELSMIAVDEDRPATRGFDLLNERALTVAGIYGPNASGKSNVIEALAWLSHAVNRSLRAWGPAVPREPFRFGRGPESPSVYDVEMIADGVRYAYHLEVSDSGVLYEALHSYPERRRRVLFEREGLEIEFRRGLGGLAGTRELLTPTTLALSAAMRANHPEIQPFGRHLSDIGVRGVSPAGMRRVTGRHAPWPLSLTEWIFSDEDPVVSGSSFDESPSPQSERDLALALLQFADLGIDGVQLVQDDQDEEDYRVRLIHKAGEQDLPFELVDESAGTRTWFALIGPMLHALRRGQILLFDEIDASLHPKLSARLLELFQDPVTNPRGAQLIFTTHDTSLLNHLNRDEVLLTEKRGDGATTLTALAEYGGDKVRRSLNLEKAYLQGRFGAVPELDQIALRRALGVIASDA
jgi:predicted ATPase